MICHYVAKYDALYKRLDHLLIGKTPEGVINYLFGPQLRMAEVMKRMLGISYKEFSQFLSPFTLLSSLEHQPNILKHTDPSCLMGT